MGRKEIIHVLLFHFIFFQIGLAIVIGLMSVIGLRHLQNIKKIRMFWKKAEIIRSIY